MIHCGQNEPMKMFFYSQDAQLGIWSQQCHRLEHKMAQNNRTHLDITFCLCASSMNIQPVEGRKNTEFIYLFMILLKKSLFKRSNIFGGE